MYLLSWRGDTNKRIATRLGGNMQSGNGIPSFDVGQALQKASPVDDMPTTVLSRGFDRVVRWVGHCMSWVWVVLMLVIILNVTMRYALGEGRIEFEELQWHLYALGWLVGLSYCYTADNHVRVDLFRDRFSPRVKAWIELLGTVFFLLPFIVLVLNYGVPFVAYSWELGEVSSAPGGLPYRWVMKGILLFSFALLGLAVIARMSRVVSFLFLTPPSITVVELNSGDALNAANDGDIEKSDKEGGRNGN